MIRTAPRWLAVLALALAALAGCAGGEVGDPEDSVAGTADGDDTAVEEPAGTPAPTVVVRDIEFQQASVTVEAGTPVTWSNEDGVAHTVTSGTPDAPTEVFDEDLPAGGEVQITLDEPGTYAYWCRIHPSMTAEVVVEPAA